MFDCNHNNILQITLFARKPIIWKHFVWSQVTKIIIIIINIINIINSNNNNNNNNSYWRIIDFNDYS